MPNFVAFAASIAELAHGQKSLTQSPSLFDALGTEALAFRKHFGTYVLWFQKMLRQFAKCLKGR